MLEIRLCQPILLKNLRGCDRMVVEFKTTRAISEFKSCEEYSIKMNVIKFVTDLRQLGSFLWVIRIRPSIKLIDGIYLKYFESGVNHLILNTHITLYLVQMIKFYLRFCF